MPQHNAMGSTVQLAAPSASRPTSRANDQAGEDLITLRLLATGLLTLADRDALLTNGLPNTTERRERDSPYPWMLQRGLNRFALACLWRGVEPVGDLAALVAFAEQPLATWPLYLPDDEVDTTATLLTPDGSGRPTRACEELAREHPDFEAELREQRLMGDVLARCRSSGAQAEYVAFRRMIIERPTLTHAELVEQLDRPELLRLAAVVHEAYPLVPPHYYQEDGMALTCSRCGCLLRRVPTLASALPRWVCVEMSCEDAVNPKGARVGRRIAARESAHWLRPELRRYILAPGRAELALAADLERLGLAVDLWPGVDQYDLRVTFANGDIWAIDVKEWSNPLRLATEIHPIPSDPPWSCAFFVFTDIRRAHYRRETGGEYRSVFLERCAALGKPCEARYSSEILAEARALQAQLARTGSASQHAAPTPAGQEGTVHHA